MKKTLFIVSCIWTVLVGASFLWNYANAKQERYSIALQTARSFFNQVLITRKWNAVHGGVYVPVTPTTQPNPYLEDPLREIRVSKDLTLTKLNPAFMTRQIAEIAAAQEGIRFHITSLKPIRPENKPTPLEEKALQAFGRGEKEWSEIVANEAHPSFFYMAPLKTDRACLSCHAKQGYKEGDVRGGISVTLPFISKIPLVALATGHLAICLFGVLGIVFFGIKLNHAYETMKLQVVIDALTGIPNRRSFSERILLEYGRSVREKTPLSVILCDIDNFKLFNDTYGHNKGDECLIKVANTITTTLKRITDFCARYGGEEFIIILPNTNLEGALIVAEAIRRNVQEMNIPHMKSLPWSVVTISLGVAADYGEVSVSHEKLISRADQALYRAKEEGRNRVEIFNSSFHKEAP